MLEMHDLINKILTFYELFLFENKTSSLKYSKIVFKKATVFKFISKSSRSWS